MPCVACMCACVADASLRDQTGGRGALPAHVRTGQSNVIGPRYVPHARAGPRLFCLTSHERNQSLSAVRLRSVIRNPQTSLTTLPRAGFAPVSILDARQTSNTTSVTLAAIDDSCLTSFKPRLPHFHPRTISNPESPSCLGHCRCSWNHTRGLALLLRGGSVSKRQHPTLLPPTMSRHHHPGQHLPWRPAASRTGFIHRHLQPSMHMISIWTSTCPRI